MHYPKTCVKLMHCIAIIFLIFFAPIYAEENPPVENNKPSGEGDLSRYNSLDSLFNLYQPYLVNIEVYEPMYFIVGTDPSKSKFQISLKYRLMNSNSAFALKHPWIRGFYIAYTQTSFWDLSSESAPFDETSYKPECFFLSPNIFFSTEKVFRLFIQSGFRHESNGQAAELSRSTNTAYLKPIFIYYNEPHKVGFQFSLKTWGFFNNDDETNPDIDEYHGFFELGLKFGRADLVVIDNTYRWAKQGGSYKLDISYPLSKYIARHLDVYFYMQYVYSLSERLIDYHDRSEAFRLGFAIVR